MTFSKLFPFPAMPIQQVPPLLQRAWTAFRSLSVRFWPFLVTAVGTSLINVATASLVNRLLTVELASLFT